MNQMIGQYVVCGGDSGVYSGFLWSAKVDGAVATVELRDARYLRRTYTVGRQGTGGISALAIYGLGSDSPSVDQPVPGLTSLLGVRRVCAVKGEVLATFGVQ